MLPLLNYEYKQSYLSVQPMSLISLLEAIISSIDFKTAITEIYDNLTFMILIGPKVYQKQK